MHARERVCVCVRVITDVCQSGSEYEVGDSDYWQLHLTFLRFRFTSVCDKNQDVCDLGLVNQKMYFLKFLFLTEKYA